MDFEVENMAAESELNGSEPLRSILFPSYAHAHPRKPIWRIQVQGILYRAGGPVTLTKRWLLKGLHRRLGVTPEISDGELFRSRVEGFLAAPESGRKVAVRFADVEFRLKNRTRSSGLFQGKFDIPFEAIPEQVRFGRSQHSGAPVEISVDPALGGGRGPVYFADRFGVSVVSDIDDTIKVTDVVSRDKMLSRTFLEDFEPVAGMAEVYQRWANQGALFHYVSSSPWQIYQPISRFLRDSGFPDGSMHLKWFRLRDEFFKRWRIIRRKSKAGVIATLMRRMPDRKFILIGDSGERDPEIYAKLVLRFPEQVQAVIIRNLAERPIDAERKRMLDKWTQGVPLILFREPNELLGCQFERSGETK